MYIRPLNNNMCIYSTYDAESWGTEERERERERAGPVKIIDFRSEESHSSIVPDHPAEATSQTHKGVRAEQSRALCTPRAGSSKHILCVTVYTYLGDS